MNAADELGNRSALRQWRHHLFRPIDIASLVYFRIAFGLLMLWELVMVFGHPSVSRFWTDPLPVMFFKYYGFSWVEVWPYWSMDQHIWTLRVLAVFIITGFFYRLSMFLFFLGFSYIFLLYQSIYLNHFYFICWVSFVLIFMPANRRFSIDAWWRKSIRSDTTPAWTMAVLVGLMSLVYFYGGLAKLNSDWFHGWPLRIWLPHKLDVLGKQEWFVYFMSYGGLLFDLSIVPLLLWRKTRVYAFCLCLFFHLMNANLFNIGLFPWFSIAATALYFSPDWPRKWVNFARKKIGMEAVLQVNQDVYRPVHSVLSYRQRVTASLLAIGVTFHLLVPFRHFLYPGDISWTEEGYRFSWHMLARDRQTILFINGKRIYNCYFIVTVSETDPATGLMKRILRKIDPVKHLLMKQVMEMGTRPDMILQFAHYLANKEKAIGNSDIIVTAHFKTGLNGRKAQFIIDPEVNLAAEPRNLKHADWILPLNENLPEL